jgi:asparagine synthase (glutamine-hydrolysing)
LPDSAKLGAISAPLKRQYTYKDSGAKRILFDVGKKLLPADFDRQIKRGFAMPFDSWLKGPLREVLMDTLSERQVKDRGLLNVTEVMTVRDEVGRSDFLWTRPWLLMTLELWLREVVDNIRKAPVACLNAIAPVVK